MDIIPVVHKSMNMEILTKLLNSVAKRYGCRVEYIAAENRLKFSGDMNYCRRVTEETLAFFPKTLKKAHIPLNCPIGQSPPSTERHGHGEPTP